MSLTSHASERRSSEFPSPSPCPPQDPYAPLGGASSSYTSASQQFQEKYADSDGVYLNRIDAGGDFTRTVKTHLNDFNPLQVEPLLAQMAALLERGLGTRAEWDRLREKNVAVWLEIQEFLALDKIHQDETAKGYYAFPYAISAASRDALRSMAGAYISAAGAMSDLLNPPAGSGEDGLNPIHRDGMASGAVTLVDPGASVARPGSTHPVGDYSTAAYGEAQFQSYIEQQNARVQLNVLNGQSDSTSGSQVAASLRAEYDNCDIGFRRARTQSARSVGAMRVVAYTAVGGALNYPEQMAPLRERFIADCEDAAQRWGALLAGLGSVYGIAIPLPDSGWTYDNMLLGVRLSIERLARLGVTEKNYVVTVPVHELVSNWADGVTAIQDGGEATWTFMLGEEWFPGDILVRLRGVSSSMLGTDGEAVFDVTAKVPAFGVMDQGPLGKGDLDQNNIPSLRMGRVMRVDSPRSPEVVGALSALNASPIGRVGDPKKPGQPDCPWTLKVRVCGPQGKTPHRSNLDGLLLNLLVAAQ